MRRTLPFAVAVLAAVSLAPAQSLLSDLRSGASDPSVASDPRGFVAFAGDTWFTAVDGNGRELWKTDGTGAGTALFVDLNPGPASSCRETTPLFVVGNLLVFAAVDPSGSRLWRTDATLAGTRPIGPRDLTLLDQDGASLVHGGVLYFAAVDGVHGVELWRTDGTDAGTRLVADINPGSASALRLPSFVPHLAPFGADVVFAADDGTSGVEPWITDGTAAGTRRIADVWAGVGDSDPRSFLELGGRLWFAASQRSNPPLFTWWSTDGTAAGTVQLNTQQIDGNANTAMRLGNVILFAGVSAQEGKELWRTDGTASGTWLVADLYPGTFWSNPRGFVELGGVAYFAARAPTEGTRLWRTDGTAQGTSLVVPASGPTPTDVGDLTRIGSWLYFGGRTSATGYEPWVTNGTPAGTSILADVNPGIMHSFAREFAPAGSNVVFQADDGTHGVEPWFTSVPSQGALLLADLHARAPASDPGTWTRAGERVFFVTQDRRELWVSDGTASGTRLVTASAGFGDVKVDGDALLVPLNTALLRVGPGDWTPRPFLSFPSVVRDAHRVGDVLYASAGPSLYRYGPGSAAPTVVRSFQGSFYAVPPIRMTGADGVLFFLASEGLFSPSGLWRSDGTAAGTVLVHPGSVGPVSGGDSVVDMLSAHGKLWFVDIGSVTATELWVADRTSVTKVADIGPRLPSYRPELVEFRGGVAFVGQDAAGGAEPWFSDGTPAGTGPIADVLPGAAGSEPGAFAVAGGVLFFAADGGIAGRELWRSDGTAAGTRQVADLVAGPGASDPAGIAAAGSGARVVFAAHDPAHGLELWVSDGTAPGTRRLADLAPGPGSSVPGGFTRASAALVFTADDGRSGREPWVLSLADAGAWLAAPYGAGCPGSAGEPRLSASGAARTGATGFGAELSSARAAASAGLLGAARPAAVVFPGGCTLLLDRPFAVAAAVTDGAGHATFALPVPASPALVGAELRLQALVADPAGALAGALALTAGLHVVVSS